MRRFTLMNRSIVLHQSRYVDFSDSTIRKNEDNFVIEFPIV